MICYKDTTFCSSDVETHTCGRELSEEDEKRAIELDLPIAYSDFCEEGIVTMKALKENQQVLNQMFNMIQENNRLRIRKPL